MGVIKGVQDPCVECGNSTAPGSGRWVNRLSVDDGWKCVECLGSPFDCDRCGEPIPFDEDSFFHGARLGPCCKKPLTKEQILAKQGMG